MRSGLLIMFFLISQDFVDFFDTYTFHCKKKRFQILTSIHTMNVFDISILLFILFSMGCLRLLSIAMIKTTSKSNVGRKKAYLPGICWPQSTEGTKSGTEAEVMEEHWLLVHPQHTYPLPFSMGWPLWHQSLIKKMSP